MPPGLWGSLSSGQDQPWALLCSSPQAWQGVCTLLLLLGSKTPAGAGSSSSLTAPDCSCCTWLHKWAIKHLQNIKKNVEEIQSSRKSHRMVTSSPVPSPSTFSNSSYQCFFAFCCFSLFYYFSASPSLAKSSFFSFQLCPVQSVSDCHFFQLVLNILIPPTHSKIYLTWLFTADFPL